MSIIEAIGLVVSVGLLGYLLYAVLYPERI